MVACVREHRGRRRVALFANFREVAAVSRGGFEQCIRMGRQIAKARVRCTGQRKYGSSRHLHDTTAIFFAITRYKALLNPRPIRGRHAPCEQLTALAGAVTWCRRSD